MIESQAWPDIRWSEEHKVCVSETIGVGIAMKGARAMSDLLDDAWFDRCLIKVDGPLVCSDVMSDWLITDDVVEV